MLCLTAEYHFSVAMKFLIIKLTSFEINLRKAEFQYILVIKLEGLSESDIMYGGINGKN